MLIFQSQIMFLQTSYRARLDVFAPVNDLHSDTHSSDHRDISGTMMTNLRCSLRSALPRLRRYRSLRRPYQFWCTMHRRPSGTARSRQHIRRYLYITHHRHHYLTNFIPHERHPHHHNHSLSHLHRHPHRDRQCYQPHGLAPHQGLRFLLHYCTITTITTM